MGVDRILRNGEQLVVCSKADMDEWEVQEKRKTVIYINNEVWRLVGKQFYTKNEVRYLLEPWPDAMREIPGRVIRYGEKYVKSRDEALRKMMFTSRISIVLYLLTPLIGFLPSPVKTKIEADFGIPARSATFISIYIELLLFFALGALIQIFSYGGLMGQQLSEHGSGIDPTFFVKNLPFSITSLLVLLSDLVLRYSSYLRDEHSPLGVFEWIWAWIYPKNPSSKIGRH